MRLPFSPRKQCIFCEILFRWRFQDVQTRTGRSGFSTSQVKYRRAPSKKRDTSPYFEGRALSNPHKVGETFESTFYFSKFKSVRKRSAREKSPSKFVFDRSNLGNSPQLLLRLVTACIDAVHDELKSNNFLEGTGLAAETLDSKLAEYKNDIYEKYDHSISNSQRGSAQGVEERRDTTCTIETLQDAYINGGRSGLENTLRQDFYHALFGQNLSATMSRTQDRLVDLRFPTEWYPATRQMQRKIHLHVGPTNSGKTYSALKRLEEADTGLYAGPLRLLAHEVYAKLQEKGRKCAMITGEERRVPLDKDGKPDTIDLYSCTVEMVPMNTKMDVAVIDEIQMIGDLERGWAWTQAFFSVQAKEVHLCGEERSVQLITALSALLGDPLEVHRYQRLSPLALDTGSLRGSFKDLRKGDCIVCFSVIAIHMLRREVEKFTKKRAAIIYGSLPPETRTQQAKLFNDPNNDYDFLIASDAIGMGINLSIKRIIFERTSKQINHDLVPLSVQHIKQIAGRAGRFRVATYASTDVDSSHVSPDPNAKSQTQTSSVADGELKHHTAETKSPSTGLVTALLDSDFRNVSEAMGSEPEPLTTAGLFPPDVIVQRFASYFPLGTPFSYIMSRLHGLARVSDYFHLCTLRDQLSIADSIQPIKYLTTMDRLIFCAAPFPQQNPEIRAFLQALARCVGEGESGNLLDLKHLDLDLLEKPVEPNQGYLKKLETLHKSIVLYLWLSYRFAGVFRSRPLAFHVKRLVEVKISQSIDALSLKPLLKFRMALDDKLIDAPHSARPNEQAHETSTGDDHDSQSEDPTVSPGLLADGEKEAEDGEAQTRTSITLGIDQYQPDASSRAAQNTH